MASNTFKSDWEKLHGDGYDAFSGLRVWNAIFNKSVKYLHKNQSVLDIGCGSGDVFENIKEHIKFYNGVDISEIACEKLRGRFKNNKKLGSIIPCDGTGIIPFVNNIFDVVLSCLVFQHLNPDILKTYISESKRILKKDGYLIFHCTEWDMKSLPDPNNEAENKDHVYGGIYSYRENYVRTLLASLGFTVIEAEKFRDAELDSVGATWWFYSARSS